jgi:hypothetical protein
MAGLDPFDLRGASVEVVAAGHVPFTAPLLKKPEYAPMNRRGLARFLLDNKTLLPPDAARYFSTAMWLLNMGEEQIRLLKPYRLRGVHGKAARIFLRNFTLLNRVYYHAAFHDIALEQAAEAVLVANPDSRRWNALQKFRDRHPEISHILDFNRERGQSDRAAGRAFNPPITLDYDLAELEKLENLSA